MTVQHSISEQNHHEIVFSIQGMSCSACANRIEKAILRMDGVNEIAVSYPLRTAWIQLKQTVVKQEELQHRIHQLGFQARPYQASSDEMRTEKRLLQRRLLWASVFTVPLLLSMLDHIPFLSSLRQMFPSFIYAPWVQLILATIVQFVIGLPFYIGAYHAIREKIANMDVLVVLGTTAAYIYSHYEVFRNGLDGLLYYLNYDQPPLYFETSAVVITVILLGKFIELSASLRMQQETDSFAQLQSLTASVERNGRLESLKAEYVRKGELVHVQSKSYIPVDGVIQNGQALIDESLLTGESRLINKLVGQKVWAGTFNAQGQLTIMTTASGHTTMLNRIREMVKQGQRSKSQIQRQVDKVSAWFVPAILLIAMLTGVGWYISGAASQGVFSVMAVLLAACPCALGLAAPISLSIATGKLADRGLIVKDASAIERLAHIDHIVFDKTGTLTEGKPYISYLKSYRRNRQDILRILAALEKDTEHHIAQAIQQELLIIAELPYQAERVKQHIGKGVEGVIREKQYYFGNRKFISEQGLTIPIYIAQLEAQREVTGETLLYLVEEQQCIAIVGLSDQIKWSANRAVDALKELQVHSVMATGDHAYPAQHVGTQIGIKHIHASLTPEQKQELITSLQAQKKIVAMVGDGWNDAPALALADVGIAMSNSTEAALDAGHMTLLYSKLTSIPSSIAMSRVTLKNIKQNLLFALIYNCLILPFAAFGLLQPWMAGVAMALSSVCVVMNALSLSYKLKKDKTVGEQR